MYTKKRKAARILSGALALSLMVLSTGCGSQGGPPQGSGGNIAVICKAEGVQFWEDVKKGASDACEELGYTLVYGTAKTDTDITTQMNLIRDYTNQGVKAIVIAPNDVNTLNAALKDAAKKGVKIVTINSDVEDPNHNFREAYIASNGVSAGGVAAREAAKLLGSEGGLIGIVGNTAGAATTVDRIGGFVDTLNTLAESAIESAKAEAEKAAAQQAAAAAESAAAAAETEGGDKPAQAQNPAEIQVQIPEIKSPYQFLDYKYCDNNRDSAKKRALEMIDQNPDLKMLYGVNENSTLGICDAVKERGMQGKIKVMGFNSSKEEIDYLENGVLNGLVVQTPYNMGYLGVRYATKLLDGDNVVESVDTGVMFVNNENLHTDVVQLLLNPSGQ